MCCRHREAGLVECRPDGLGICLGDAVGVLDAVEAGPGDVIEEFGDGTVHVSERVQLDGTGH
mgnify:CR=1 FL=1